MIFLAKIQARDIVDDSLVTFYYTSGPGMFDNDGNFYEPRIEQPALMKRSLSDKGFAGGISETYGELTLINNDGGLDHLFNRYMFAGQSLTLMVGNDGDVYDAFSTILVVTLFHPSFERDRISFRIRDYSSTFDKAFLTSTYAGTNIGPDGLEGDSSIKGQKKPICLGRPYNITPVLVNSSLLIYQVSAWAVDDIVRVRDRGVALGREADYTSEVQMQSEDPSPGFYRVYPAGGMFRVGTAPFGGVTACVIHHIEPWKNTVGYLIKEVVSSLLSPSQYMEDDFTKLDSYISANVGYFATDEISIAELLDALTLSVGAWWGFDSLGRFRLGHIDYNDDWYISDSPYGGEVRISDSNILDFNTESLTYDGVPCPLYKVTVNHSKNWTVQDVSELAGSIGYSQQNWVANEFRQSVRQVDGYTTNYPMAGEVVLTTYLCSSNAGSDASGYGYSKDYAVTIANNILQSFRSRVDNLIPGISELTNTLLTVKIAIDEAYLYQIRLGLKISVLLSRFSISSMGDWWMVTAMEVDYQRNEMSLTLFRV